MISLTEQQQNLGAFMVEFIQDFTAISYKDFNEKYPEYHEQFENKSNGVGKYFLYLMQKENGGN
ncbi:MAG: hypothetical protein WC389_13875 [Lutibacter sp.]|jgi:hypothetical protein